MSLLFPMTLDLPIRRSRLLCWCHRLRHLGDLQSLPLWSPWLLLVVGLRLTSPLLSRMWRYLKVVLHLWLRCSSVHLVVVLRSLVVRRRWWFRRASLLPTVVLRV